MDKIIINGRTYTIDRDNQMKSIKRTLEMHSDTPLRQSKHAELLNKLQKYDLNKRNENELEEVLPLVLKTVNKNKKIDEKIEKENEKYDCERCGHKNKKKINLTKHLKKVNNAEFGTIKRQSPSNSAIKTNVISSHEKTVI